MAATVVLAAPAGAALLGATATGLRDEHVLRQRGIVTTATIVEVDTFKNGTTVVARFTTSTGATTQATVNDATSAPRMVPGAPIRIRYDPQAPADRAEDAATGSDLAGELGDDAFGAFAVALSALLIAAAGFCVWLLLPVRLTDALSDRISARLARRTRRAGQRP